MLHMLDTDLSSTIIKGNAPEVQARLSGVDPSSVCVSAITRAELLYGLKHLPAGHRLHMYVRQFLRIVRVLAWDADAAEFYADIRHQLSGTGQPIREMDMMIAAHSLAAPAILVTNDMRHYSRIAAPLVLQNWQ